MCVCRPPTLNSKGRALLWDPFRGIYFLKHRHSYHVASYFFIFYFLKWSFKSNCCWLAFSDLHRFQTGFICALSLETCVEMISTCVCEANTRHSLVISWTQLMEKPVSIIRWKKRKWLMSLRIILRCSWEILPWCILGIVSHSSFV